MSYPKLSLEIGKRFGRLVLVNKVGRTNHRYTTWECKCDCGNYHIVSSQSLRSGRTQSCGCLRKETVSNSNKKIKVGQKFNLLTVLEENKERKNGYVTWHCKCDCGNITNVRSSHLLSGKTKSCGCIQKTCRAKYNKIKGELTN